MSGAEIAAIIGAVGGLLVPGGTAIGWLIKRVDAKVARLERRISRLEKHKLAAIRYIGRLEHEIMRMGGTLPETDGWPPDDEDDLDGEE